MLVNITDIFFHINFSMYFFLGKKKIILYTYGKKKFNFTSDKNRGSSKKKAKWPLLAEKQIAFVCAEIVLYFISVRNVSVW